MNISTDTLAILKNFSEINDNILFKPGSKLSTISAMKNILAEAIITEKFDREFGIYNLPEFIRAVELFENPSVKINGANYAVISDQKTGKTVNYYFADKSVLVSPQKNINIPDKTITFTLKRDGLAHLQKSALSMSLPDVAVKGDGKNIFLLAHDKKNKSSNSYSDKVGETDKVFMANFKSENFKIIADDYDVAISKAKVSHFINRSKPIQYWIALEPDSEF
jgi:hypothetical protein